MIEASHTRRRWFQFSLTSLFVATTLIAIWLAWELAFIRERQAWLRENAALVDSDRGPVLAPVLMPITGSTTGSAATLAITAAPASPPREAFIPRWRKWLGDAPVATIVDAGFTDDDRARVTRLFPEAELVPPPVSGTITFTESLFTNTVDPGESEAPAAPDTDQPNSPVAPP